MPLLTAGRTRGPVRAWVRLLRPRQWVKNLLVLAAPAAAGVIDQPTQALNTAIAFVAFCLAASGTYCLNDAFDVLRDGAHPTKRLRPVAAGHIGVGSAKAVGVVLLVAALALSALNSTELLLATLAYVSLTTAYTLSLKHIAVIDVAAVAAGFVIRAVAGAAATHVPVSNWFLIVASAGSFFMVTGKRSAEMSLVGIDGVGHREVLSQYSVNFLVYLRSMSSAVTLFAYTLFAFEKAEQVDAFAWFELSIVPFTLAVLRYALRLDRGDGGAPEDVVLGDRTLQVLGGLWAVLFLLGVYTG